jgi:DNA-binding protein
MVTEFLRMSSYLVIVFMWSGNEIIIAMQGLAIRKLCDTLHICQHRFLTL